MSSKFTATSKHMLCAFCWCCCCCCCSFSHLEKNASQGILKSQLESLRKCKQIEPIQKKNVHLQWFSYVVFVGTFLDHCRWTLKNHHNHPEILADSDQSCMELWTMRTLPANVTGEENSAKWSIVNTPHIHIYMSSVIFISIQIYNIK